MLGGIIIRKTKLERPWQITHKEAFKLIKKSGGDVDNLSKIEGLKLSSHLEKCESCEEKFEQEKKQRR